MASVLRNSIRHISASSSRLSNEHLLRLDNLNPHVKALQYAVRGPIVIRANEIEKELKGGAKKPFKTVIKANIGDAMAMGQKPLTFVRQVVALCAYPSLMTSDLFPADVKKHAQKILNGCGGQSLGAYTMSDGIEVVRQDVADFISARDGTPAKLDDIFVHGGASELIRTVLKLFQVTTGRKTGVMIPIPQYPLYSASIEEFGMDQVGYFLDEKNGWALDIDELDRALAESRDTCDTRVLCVINPGNPTGQVLSRDNIESIIRFAHANKLFLLADEVYQENVYHPQCKFHSFKKVMSEMGAPYNQHELVSFHSVSKGFFGECGMRGGYAEVLNMDPDVKAMLRKAQSAKLCSTTVGQTIVDCMVSPPKPGEESYDLFEREKADRLASLAQRARLLEDLLNKVDGVNCNPVQGAMYAFPKLDLPTRAVEEAKKRGLAPDMFYALQLLENTGICVVPGSGFGQLPGTHHFRTTILPQLDALKSMLQLFSDYHVKFLSEYS